MEIIKGPTPNGGAYAHIYYFDDENKTSDKENATNGYILEFNEKGNRICETYFVINDNSKKSNNIEKIDVLNLD